MKTLKFVILILVTLLIFSCDKDESVNYDTGTPVLLEIEQDSTFIGDTISIIGSYFLSEEIERVEIDTFSYVSFEDFVLLQDSRIRIVIPDSAEGNWLRIRFSETLTDSLPIYIHKYQPIETVEVSGGTFLRGSVSGSNDELPIREITITNDLIVSKYEINQRVYEQIMDENPSPKVRNDLPVQAVTWYDAVRFCNRLSELDSLPKAYNIVGNSVDWVEDATGWRLPTEAEWEYLCRAGDGSDYSGFADVDPTGWFSGNSGLNPQAVGTKLPNDFGIYDMHGNVWEWCWDYYSLNYYSQSETTDPKGPINGTTGVMRGGSYFDGIFFLRSSNRTRNNNSENYVGIRIVRNK